MQVITYEVRADAADENEALVRAVYAEIAAAAPDGLSYATLRLGTTFMHFHDGSAPALTELPAFKAFQAGLRERCVSPPEFRDAERVGAYGWSA
jgi:hypothetical protein